MSTAAKTNGPAILCQARGVTHDFTQPGGQKLRVLENVDLEIRRDEVVALLGPSGCGKSTLLRILAGLIPPTEGQVLYHDQPLQGLNPGVAFVFQSFALYPWMTVRQNIAVALEAAGLEAKLIEERTQSAIRMIGLAGFELAYPRELSGGMKQRAGMARALAVDPEILFLDEPFSHVDSLTAESLRAEIIDIWAAADKNPSAMVLVSHDIKEVASMADRVVLMDAHPGRIRTVIANGLARPRDYHSPELNDLVEQLHEAIAGHFMADAPAALETSNVVEPLPDASGSEIIGLLEYLDARGGRQDLFKIAVETHQEFGRLINVSKAAEMLDFVDTPRRVVVLEPEGKRFVQASQEERKPIWRAQLLKLRLFRDVYEAALRQPDRSVERDFVLETIVMHLPSEDYEKTFQRFIRWSRIGRLFVYNQSKEKLQAI